MTVAEQPLNGRVDVPALPVAIPALLGAMALWGGTYVITRWALAGFGPFTVLLSRLAIGGAVLTPFARRRGFTARMIADPRLILFGVTGMVLHLGFEIVGLKYTSASSAALVIASAPAVTAAFSIAFLGERLTVLRWLGIAASIAGVVLVTQGETDPTYPLAWIGNLLVFGGVIMWGVFTIQGKKMSLHLPPLVTTTAATIAAAILTIPMAAGEIALTGAPNITVSSALSLLYLGIFASAAAYGLWNSALRHVDASVAGPFINLVPVLGVIFALLIGERLTVLQVIGGLVVALGIAVSHKG